MSAIPSTMPLPPVVVSQTTAEFTDYCDRCGVSAKSHFYLTSGGELTFCGHHGREYSESLATMIEKLSIEEGFDWTDW